MRNTAVIALFCLLLSGCSKDKFSSTPIIKFKSFNTNELRPGQDLRITLSFTDKEGDLQDSLYIEKITPNCAQSTFKAYYILPEFPAATNSSGDIMISYTHGSGGNYPVIQPPQCAGENDTCYFRFVLQDEAKHKSDTINSETLIIYQ